MSIVSIAYNRQCVAIATDRAMRADGFLQSITMKNNIFKLTDSVAIASYHDYTFMGMPLDVVLNEFRLCLGDKKLDTVYEYVRFFKKFLKVHKFYDNLNLGCYPYELFCSYAESIFNRVQKTKSIKGNTTDLLKVELEGLISEYSKKKAYECFKDFSYDEFVDRYSERWKSDQIGALRHKALDNFDKGNWDLLSKAFYGYLTTTIQSDIFTGLVFFGFGKKDVLPSVCSLTITTSLDGNLLCKEDCVKHFSFNGINSIEVNRPFKISLFGVRGLMRNFFNCIKPEILSKMCDYIGVFTEAGMAKVVESLATLCILGCGENPFADASINKIDVAVISKVDGFKWINCN